MKARAIWTVFFVMAIFAFFSAAQSGEKTKKKRHGSGKTSEQTTSQQGTPNQGQPAAGTPPPAPTKKPRKPEKIKRVGTLGDIAVERVWLDNECRINFNLRNKGKWNMSSLEHMKGVVRIYFGDEHEDFWVNRISKKGKKAVDLSGALKRPRAMVSYNTKIKLSKAQKVHVVFLPSSQLSRLRLSQVKAREKTLIPRCLPAGPGEDTGQSPADLPASADASASRPRPDFGESGSSTPRVQVIEPNGGEFWEECTLGRVRWRYFGPVSDLPEFWGIDLFTTCEGGVGHKWSRIPSSECCVHVTDTRGNYYECTKSLRGSCIPKCDYEISVWSDRPRGPERDSSIFLYDWSDDSFQIGRREGIAAGDVRIRGFKFNDLDWLGPRPGCAGVSVAIDATATAHGLEFVQIEFEGHVVYRVDTPGDTHTIDYLSLDLIGYVTENGTYPLRAYAEDREGNSDSHTLHLNVDLDVPTMTVNSPREGDVYYADLISGMANVTFDITASDDFSGVYTIWIGPNEHEFEAACYQSPCRYSLAYPIGEHRAYICAYDRASNKVEQEITFSVRSAAERPAY